MKVVISVCTFAAAIVLVAGAPRFIDLVEPEQVQYGGLPFLRAQRSYGGGYASPCSAALPLGPIGPAGSAGGYGGYGPVHAAGGYGGGYGGGAHGAAAAAYAGPAYGGGYGAPHYRADEADTEILNFSDMDQGMSEHQPMARYGGYGGAVAAHGAGLAGLGYGGQLAPVVAAGPAYGVFPNANVGGCNVPLLLSCSPSIVPGKLVKAGYGGGAAGYGAGAAGYGAGAASVALAPAPNAYRGADETHHEHEEHAEEMSSHSVEHSDETTHTESH